MAVRRLPKIGLIWTQFAAYHIDRCEKVGSYLHGRAAVLAVEVATGSKTYEWEASGTLTHAQKVTLFPGRTYEDLSKPKLFFATLRALRRYDIVFFGIGYNELFIIAVAWTLRLMGTRVVMMTDSKFDDSPRNIIFELMKSFVLCVFQGAVVAGHRQRDYLRFLGFFRRPILLGYDCVGIERIRQQITADLPAPTYGERDFICVARLVPKKNLFLLIDAFTAYRQKAGGGARKLLLVGSGPQEDALRQRVQQLGMADAVIFCGFRQSAEVANLLSRALALVLISVEEQWGLVVNEAVALGLPLIVSDSVGASDILVANLMNGYVVPSWGTEQITGAMLRLAGNEEEWLRMRSASLAVADQGDVAVFAQAVATMTTDLLRLSCERDTAA